MVVLDLFCRSVGCIESSEAEEVAILEALRMFVGSFRANWIVESDSVIPPMPLVGF